jgi:hypothetical protein
MDYKCNNYHSSYCFIDNKPINTIDYEKLKQVIKDNIYDFDDIVKEYQ